MRSFCHPGLHARRLGGVGHTVPRKGPGEEAGEDQEGLELPVSPDQGTPLVPDEEGVVTVPA